MLWGLQIGTPVHQRKVPDWEVVARMQEGERRRRDGSQGGREPERIVVTQGDQLERMPPRQVQEPDLIIPSQQSSQVSLVSCNILSLALQGSDTDFQNFMKLLNSMSNFTQKEIF